MAQEQSQGGIERNVDAAVVEDFGREWQAFNQRTIDDRELAVGFEEYFHLFPFDRLSAAARGFDMGCGSGRWARLVAPRVGHLTCIDPSPVALEQAKANLAQRGNVEFECASVAESRLPDASQDFGYCLGVLHHIPDTVAGLRACTAKLKPGAPFLLYLYYRFDNRPAWFRGIWRMTDVARRAISALPFALKFAVSQAIAVLVYVPLAKGSAVLERVGVPVDHIPLSAYRDKSFYFMRTDALDRFGTRLEKRFTRAEIAGMMREAGLVDVRFSDRAPYWVAVGTRVG